MVTLDLLSDFVPLEISFLITGLATMNRIKIDPSSIPTIVQAEVVSGRIEFPNTSLPNIIANARYNGKTLLVIGTCFVFIFFLGRKIVYYQFIYNIWKVIQDGSKTRTTPGAAVGKHFPGHGSVIEDSHFSIPVDHRPFENINMHDLIPFKTLIDAGILGLMPAHVIYSEVDKIPAGFSSVWLGEILRKQLKFQGTIFSDDLSMEGAKIIGDYTERTKAALEAGCDMVLICNNKEGVISVLDQVKTSSNVKSLSCLEKMCGNFNDTYDDLKNKKLWQECYREIKSFLDKRD